MINLGRQILRLKIWSVKMWNVNQEANKEVALGKKETLTAKVELLTLLPIATA
jgi:hypothetical protein